MHANQQITMAPPLSAGLIMISLLFLGWLMEWTSVDVIFQIALL